MSRRAPATTSSPWDDVPDDRPSVAIYLAMLGWVLAVGLGAIGWNLLNSQVDSKIQVGTWVLGFAVLSALIGWIGTVGSLIRDRGRRRIAALVLFVIPFVGLAMLWVMLNDTTLDPNDPLKAIWCVYTLISVGIAALLVFAPNSVAQRRSPKAR